MPIIVHIIEIYFTHIKLILNEFSKTNFCTLFFPVNNEEDSDEEDSLPLSTISSTKDKNTDIIKNPSENPDTKISRSNELITKKPEP